MSELAYKNKPSIKKKYVARVKAHRDADEIVKGIYWENGKGCAVGCTIEGRDHSKYETELGIPRILAHLEDTIFEGLPNGTPKGQKALDKAVKQSMKDQREMSKKAMKAKDSNDR